MTYDEIIEKYRLDDICPEIDNELNGMFIDILGDEFEMGIFPEPSPKDDDNFVVSVDITCDGVSLQVDDLKKIRDSVEERLIYNIGKDWKTVQKKFDGVQIFFNGEIHP
jgi:hypothetical protein